MRNIFIKSNIVIIILAVLSIIGFIIVENTMTFVKQDHFDEKFKAATVTKEAVNYLKEYRMRNVLFVDNINDPNETGIIGQKYTQITTENSSLQVKLSATNSNFAALAVQFLKEAGLEKGDVAAVCMSGSFPVLNIATLAAMEELKLKPIIIISATSSSWGANDPDFTFPDMICKLQDASFFKDLKFKYVSIGGVQDVGMSLSKKGRKLIIEAIERNELSLLNKGDLESNINERIRIIDELSYGEPIKVFVNIGGGVASIGTSKNGYAVPSGLNKEIKLRNIPDKIGVVYEMAKRDVPVIHFSNINKLTEAYDLPNNPVPLPEVGSGELFYVYKYNMKIVIAVTVILIVVIAFFVYFDRKNNKLGNEIISDEIQI